ncbi:hypothetical protein FGRMN_649 [Fusarium graminum]|nr:hypothetical protein FGRMN_649 [Fusarium graminum]
MDRSWARIWPVIFATLFLTAVAFNSLYPGDDPYRCRALQNTGQWIDPPDKDGNRDPFRQWQPDGCMINRYTSEDIRRCTEGRRIIVAGDSTSRNTGLAMARVIDEKHWEIDESKGLHAKMKSFNMTYRGQMIQRITNVWISAHGVPGREQFVDNIETYAREKTIVPTIKDQKGPALIYLSAGAWFTHPDVVTMENNLTDPWDERFALYKNHLTNVDKIIGDNTPRIDPFTAPMDPVDGIGNQIFYAPPAGPRYLDNITELIKDRGRRAAEVNEMQDWLHNTEDQMAIPLVWSIANLVEGQDLIWRDSLGRGLGFHVKFHVAELRAHIILNLRCNAKLDRMKSYPYSRTCCTDYGVKPLAQLGVVAFAVVYLMMCIVCEVLDLYANRKVSEPRWKLLNMRVGVLVLAVLMCHYADRTQMMAKGSKLWQFKDLALLCVACIAIIIPTTRLSAPSPSLSLTINETDETFLSQDQTDEWKGWMQAFVMIFHWTGADGSSFYVLFRLCMAAYLFQSGYEHTLIFLKKDNFSFDRMAYSLLRLNILSCCLVYVMDTDNMLYYLPPLISFWLIVVYITLSFGGNNSDTQVVLTKICTSCLILSFLLFGTPFTSWAVGLLRLVFKVEWTGKTWQNRVTLDMFIVYAGMLTAVASREMKSREIQLNLRLRVSIALLSFLAICRYFFVMSDVVLSKYGKWHPYISVIPILAYVAIRNVTDPARSYHSRAMVWLGRFSLEAWILQYHILLAADGEGVMIVDGLFGDGSLLRDRWRTLVITLPIFLWISHSVAGSTAYITKLIMHTSPEDEKVGRSFGWQARLSEWKVTRPQVRIAWILLVMWLLNMMTPGHSVPAPFLGGHNVTISEYPPKETPALVPMPTGI